MATITFDQTGLSAGVTDRARSDGLDTGATVTITVSPSGGTVEFVDVPLGDTTAVSSLSGGPTVWTFSPTASVYGTWLVQYTQGGATVRRSFAVRTVNHGLRIPAFNEKASIIATIANGSSHIADSDDNEGGTYTGWSPSLVELYNEVESGAPNTHAISHQNGGGDEISVAGLSGLLADAQTPLSHASSHQNGGGDEVATATPGANAIPKANSSGKLASGWTSLSQTTATGPTTSNPSVNNLVFCDVASGSVTVNLPSGHVAGDAMIVKIITTAANSVTIDPNGSETVDGASTLVLSNDYEWAWLISNGTNWFQIS